MFKMTYLRIASHKNFRTNAIDTQRFGAEIDIDVEGLDKVAKLTKMQAAAYDLSCAGSMMLKEMLLAEESNQR